MIIEGSDYVHPIAIYLTSKNWIKILLKSKTIIKIIRKNFIVRKIFAHCCDRHLYQLNWGTFYSNCFYSVYL